MSGMPSTRKYTRAIPDASLDVDGLEFYDHVSFLKGGLVYASHLTTVSATYAKEITTPVLFMTGKDNRVFTDSNIECHRRLEQIVPGRHELHVFPGYGHQDPFMGKNNHVDIFPRLVEFLNKHRRDRAIAAAPAS